MTNNSRPQRVPTRFGREIRFQLKPSIATLSADLAQARFEQLKARLLNPVLSDTRDRELRHQLVLAANEAAAVAWTTPVPFLVLPLLIEEKASEVHQYAARQNRVQDLTAALTDLSG
jgi:hypothetical protein